MENRTKREHGFISHAMADTYMETIANIKQSGKWLVVTCQSCGRSTQFPPPCIPPKLLDELPVALAAAHFRCTRCRGKQLESSSLDPGRLNNQRTPRRHH
jgi:predicted nucleic-acid-binding Zn-ribbon protein